jgi:hypothetical protein
LVLELRLQFFVFLDLSSRFHEILLNAVISVLANGEHTGLSADVSQICSVELLADLGEGFEVNITLGGDGF